MKEQLLQLARDGKLLHAYILESRDNHILISFAKDLAKEITSYTEDIHTISTDGSSVKDKAVEELLGRLHLKPLVGDWIVAVIQDADTMTQRAQNRLLKTLEEPPTGTVIFLLSNNAENLIPTIRSRCVLLRLDEEDGGADLFTEAAVEQAYSIGTMILKGNSYYAIVSKLQEITGERDRAYAFLDALEKWYRDLLLCTVGISFERIDIQTQKLSGLLSRDKAYEAISLIEEARRDLNRHINTSYTIKNMVLKLL